MKTFKRFEQAFDLKRFGAGHYSGGDWVAGSAYVTVGYGSIQPMQGFDLLILPEGERAKGSILVKMDTEMLVADETTQISADQILYDGHWYQVMQVQKWGAHYEAIAVRITGQ